MEIILQEVSASYDLFAVTSEIISDDYNLCSSQLLLSLRNLVWKARKALEPISILERKVKQKLYPLQTRSHLLSPSGKLVSNFRDVQRVTVRIIIISWCAVAGMAKWYKGNISKWLCSSSYWQSNSIYLVSHYRTLWRSEASTEEQIRRPKRNRNKLWTAWLLEGKIVIWRKWGKLSTYKILQWGGLLVAFQNGEYCRYYSIYYYSLTSNSHSNSEPWGSTNKGLGLCTLISVYNSSSEYFVF